MAERDDPRPDDRPDLAEPRAEAQLDAIARAEALDSADDAAGPTDWTELVKPLVLNPYFIGFVVILGLVLSRFW